MMNDPHFHIAEVCQAENYKKSKTMVNLSKGIKFVVLHGDLGTKMILAR